MNNVIYKIPNIHLPRKKKKNINKWINHCYPSIKTKGLMQNMRISICQTIFTECSFTYNGIKLK